VIAPDHRLGVIFARNSHHKLAKTFRLNA
jgi:hypothetical protein